MLLGVLGGRAGPRPSWIAAPPEARALVLLLGDEFGKVALWTRSWGPGVPLASPGERGLELQRFDQGGECWPRGGSRVIFPGALYGVCRDHEEHTDGASLLTALRASWPQVVSPGAS
ncbi:MAG: hypothetical protein D6731_26145 [Planctomycetota bacterium]|nr:MAG: hypothetical protein D6731_26145 [Planctomycetota bacterium]